MAETVLPDGTSKIRAWSDDQVRIDRESAEKPAHVTLCSWPRKTDNSWYVDASQILAPFSNGAAMYPPVAKKGARDAPLRFPLRKNCFSKRLAFQILADPSFDAVAKSVPSG